MGRVSPRLESDIRSNFALISSSVNTTEFLTFISLNEKGVYLLSKQLIMKNLFSALSGKRKVLARSYRSTVDSFQIGNNLQRIGGIQYFPQKG